MVQTTNPKGAAKAEVGGIIPWLQVRILPVLFVPPVQGFEIVEWVVDDAEQPGGPWVFLGPVDWLFRKDMPTDRASNLYYEASGSATAKSIVFLHGGGVAGWMWREQVLALQADYHCLVPDLPEQGKTLATETEPFTMERAADRVAAFIRSQANGGTAHVVGLSQGAQVSVSLLSRAPEVIDHAVVSSASLRPMLVQSLCPGWLIALTYRLLMAPFKGNDWWIRQNLRAAGIPDAYFREFKQSFQEMTAASLQHQLLATLRFRLPSGLDRVRRKVLVAVGLREYRAMKQSAKDLATVLPESRGVVVTLGPGSTLAREHLWAMTAPEFFTATLKAWIEDRPLPAGLLPL